METRECVDKDNSFNINKMISRKKVRAFTLIEVMVVSVLLLTGIAMILSYLFEFNRNSTRQIILNSLQDENRKAIRRLEIEISSAIKVIPAYNFGEGMVYSGKERVILAVPFEKNNFMAFNANGTPKVDVVSVYQENDGEKLTIKKEKDLRSLIGKIKLKKSRLKFSLSKNNDSPRNGNLYGQIIHQNLMPFEYFVQSGFEGDHCYILPPLIKRDLRGNYLPDENSRSNPDVYKPISLFTYYDSSGKNITEKVANGLDTEKVGYLRVTMWAEGEYSDVTITAKSEFEIKLRNFSRN